MKGNHMNEQHDSKLPVIQFDGGESKDRLVQGVILKCVDGRWKAHDDTPLHKEMQFFVFGITKGLQCWEEERVIEEVKKKPSEDLPDVEALNRAIPREQWEAGLDGKPRPPWQLNDVIYLLSVNDAMKFTYLNSTAGARIAAARLLDRIESMQMLRGPNIIPIVTLDARPMKTGFGEKMRPHFEIVGWRDFGPTVPAVAPTTTPQLGSAVDTKAIGKPVKEPTLAEELNDSIPI
jgi:hypothetical protein